MALLWFLRLELPRIRATKQKGQAEPEPGYVMAERGQGEKAVLTAQCSFVLVTCLWRSLLQAAEPREALQDKTSQAQGAAPRMAAGAAGR